jgi:hypothetical protein
MRKKAKSFAVEEEQYNELFGLFREYDVEVSISYCINRYIKEFLEYLKQIQKEIQKDVSLTVPMAFIIEFMAREPNFRKFDSDSSTRDEVKTLQEKYNIYIKKNPEKAKELDGKSTSDEIEFLKVINWLGKVALQELKAGRQMTTDELREMAVQVGGKQFLKAFRTKVGPIAEKVEKYDPDLRDIYSKVMNKIFNIKGGK